MTTSTLRILSTLHISAMYCAEKQSGASRTRSMNMRVTATALSSVSMRKAATILRTCVTLRPKLSSSSARVSSVKERTIAASQSTSCCRCTGGRLRSSDLNQCDGR